MNTAIDSGKVVALREVLRERFPEAHHGAAREAAGAPDAWETGVPCLDAAGVAAGTLLEVTGTGGGGLVVAGLLEGAQRNGHHVALVDAADCFDPQDAGELACQRMLWVRCGGKDGVRNAVRATDLLLRDGNIPLVVADLQLCPLREIGRVPGSTWFRLRGLAERGGGLLVALTPTACVGCADLRVTLDFCPTAADGDRLRADLLDATVLRGSVSRRRGERLEAQGTRKFA